MIARIAILLALTAYSTYASFGQLRDVVIVGVVLGVAIIACLFHDIMRN